MLHLRKVLPDESYLTAVRGLNYLAAVLRLIVCTSAKIRQD